MSISVVTVALNAGRDLPLTIESVLQQDFPDVEHVVLDGGSWDDTPAILGRYKGHIDKLVRVEDAGVYFAMNMALDHCTGSHVIFLNAGDRFYGANVLSKITAMLRDDPDVFFGDHVYVDRGRETLTRAADYGLTMRQLRTGRIDYRWLGRLPGHQATFMRVDLLRRLRFNTGIEICADHDVLARAYAAGARMQYVDQTVSHYVGGGLSAQRSSRLMLEWAGLYREYSDRPEDVDLFFLGSTPSPFGAQNKRAGSYLTGSFRRETCPDHGIEEHIHWCAADGFQLRTAEGVASSGLTLKGFNPFHKQRLALFVDGQLIGNEPIDHGWFTQAFRLTQPLAGGTTVDVVPTQGGPVSVSDRRIVGVALAWFAFRAVEDGQTTLRAGTRVAFTIAHAHETAPMLGGGWSAQEAEHIWSVGGASQLALNIGPEVSQVTLVLRGNPFLQDNGKRGVDVDVNGQRVSRTLLGVGNTEVELDCAGELWKRGRTNSIVLRPLATKSSPNDSRALGVCLYAIECR